MTKINTRKQLTKAIKKETNKIGPTKNDYLIFKKKTVQIMR